MKWLIVSDTHGLKREVEELKNRYAGKVEAFIHCGDSELHADSPEMKDYLAVEGNCDFPGAYPDEVVRQSGPLTFLIAHGHLLGVRNSPVRLIYRGLEVKADILCFGHTHFAGSFKENGMIGINPGSLRLPRNYKTGTYVILDLSEDKKKIKVNYFTLKGQPVDSFSATYTWEK
ncbi:metallophosphoesterase [Sporolactobacillus sp. THM19-2]|uniref:metallophosphoesterase n=1 Tax=Sporolactobacillus sp. THM19-2 TaxID=2511171 RepID=UPI00101FEABB|nr:metallophosphoesterase [Sporolactobacillus sp. THM19-2]RYL94648.1 metallophosphoesterase [Sporolactobacillus sp. THM19-2]